MTIKDKLVECISINLAKEKCGNPNKSYQFYVEAELILKQLFLDVLIERSKGDPLEYITFLENVEELCGLDYYDIESIENFVFGEWIYN